jgi:hypothetical protein
MKLDNLVAIDVHTHAEVSCRQDPDPFGKPFDDAASKYFKANKRITIAETVAYYRERKIGLVMFTVDTEFEMGVRRIPNEEVADTARENSDMMLAFASIDPHKGKMGIREARRLIDSGGISGFKFHPTCQGFTPNDRMRLPFTWTMWRWISPTSPSSSRIPPGRGRTKHYPCACTNPMCTSICRAGRPSIFRRSWCITPTPSSSTRCCSDRTFR